MNKIKNALSCLLLAAALPAFADAVKLDFDAAAGYTPVEGSTLQLADGRVDLSAGNVWLLGSALHKDFQNPKSSDVLGNFYGTRTSDSADSNRGALWMTSDPTGKTPNTASSFTISIANGFNGLFSLDFAGSETSSAWLTAYDSNGKQYTFGAPIPSGALCSGFACDWGGHDSLVIDLSSNIDIVSVVVNGTGTLWFDNMTFADLLPADTTPPGNVPEPGGIALSMAALGALAWTRKRRIQAGKQG